MTDPRFWDGKEVVDRQRALHIAVTCAWVTIIAAVLGPSGWWHRVCLGAGAVVLLGSAVLTASQQTDRYTVRHKPDEPPISGRRFAAWLRDPIGTPQRRIGLIVVAATVTVLTLGVDAVDGTWTGRYYVTEHLCTFWLWLIATQLGLLAVLGLRVWRTAPGRSDDDPGPGPFLRGHLSTVFVALAVLLGGVLSAVVAIGFARLFGDPVPSGQGGAASAVVVPWPLYAFAAAPLVIPAAAILAVILLFVRFCTQRSHYYNQVDMAYPKPRASADTNRRKIAAAWAAADLADDVGWVVAVVTVSGWAVVASVALALDRGRGGLGGITDKVVSTGSLLAVLIAGGLVALLRSAYAGGARRREIGSVWDVGTFWPRAAHPLAPPCYAERAVPEVVDRIRELTGRIPRRTRMTHPGPPRNGLTVPAGPVLLTGYSQGSILAPAVVAQLPPDARRDIALLTLACPARRLYGRAFPDFFGPEQLRVLATLMTGKDGVRRWTNVVRRSDYIGSWVGRSEPGATTAVAGLEDVDKWIDDPVALVPDDHPRPVIHRHSGWWPDPQVCGQRRASGRPPRSGRVREGRVLDPSPSRRTSTAGVRSRRPSGAWRTAGRATAPRSRLMSTRARGDVCFAVPRGRPCLPSYRACELADRHGGRERGRRASARRAAVSPAVFRGFVVVVSGAPASGKSTLAPALAAELDLPLLAKDAVKDALVDVLGAPDLPRSRELGRAAVQVLLAVAATAGALRCWRACGTATPGPAGGAARPDRRGVLPLRPGRAARAGSPPGARAAPPATTTMSAAPRSCGTARSGRRSRAAGRCWRSTPGSRWTSRRSPDGSGRPPLLP